MEIVEKYEKIKDLLGKGYEKNTILEESDLEKTQENLDFIGAVDCLDKLKAIDDWVAFEKITLALNGKKVVFSKKQEPTLYDVVRAYLFVKNHDIEIGEEVKKYVASVFISKQMIVVPENMVEIQKEINRYLTSNNPHLLRKIPVIKERKRVGEGSLEDNQIDMLEDLEKMIKE